MSNAARDEIRQQLLQARSDLAQWFHLMTSSGWDEPVPGSGWTARQELAWIAQRTELLAPQASGAANKRSFLNYPQPVLLFFERLGIRRAARRKIPPALLENFQKSFHTAILLLEDIPEDRWQNGAKILGRYQTVEQVYREYLDFLHARLQEVRPLTDQTDR